VVSTYTLEPDPDVIDLLRSLAPGSVVAQLADGSLAVCADVDEALRRFDEQNSSPRAAMRGRVLGDRGWSRLAATLASCE